MFWHLRTESSRKFDVFTWMTGNTEKFPIVSKMFTTSLSSVGLQIRGTFFLILLKNIPKFSQTTFAVKRGHVDHHGAPITLSDTMCGLKML